MISVVLLVLATGLTFQQHAEAQQYSIKSSVFGNGGGVIENGSYRVVGTIGQPMIGVVSSSSNNMSAGFWYPVISSQLNESSPRFDRRTGYFSVMTTWTNTGSINLMAPLYVCIENITPDTVTFVGCCDDVPQDCCDFSDLVGDDNMLSSGETSGSCQFIFDNPGRVRFTFDVTFRAKVWEDDVAGAPSLKLIGQAQRISIPAVSTLAQNYPNPFNPETWIPYELAKATDVKIDIYDIQGKIVRTIDLGHREVGQYFNKEEAAYWDGRNEFGEKVSSGVYFYRIQAGDFQAVRKMVILK
jgi:hypothetical protein